MEHETRNANLWSSPTASPVAIIIFSRHLYFSETFWKARGDVNMDGQNVWK